MNRFLMLITSVILFISILTALYTMDGIMKKYKDCRESMTSDDPICSVGALGRMLSTSFAILGMLIIICCGAIYILIRGVSSKQKYEYSRYA
jgi:Na+/pantothenate symporter